MRVEKSRAETLEVLKIEKSMHSSDFQDGGKRR